MSDLPLHPRLVHLPLGLGVALPLATLAVTLLEARGDVGAGAWPLLVGLQALLVVSCLPALRSGELARPRVKPLLPEGVLGRHRKASRVFFLASVVTLAAMLLAVFTTGSTHDLGARAAVALGGVALLLGARAGRTGGEVVYLHGGAQAYFRSGGM
jgi:uncharacterized membrane protein